MRKSLLAAAIAVAMVRPALATEWVVEAHYPDSAALARAAARFEHVIVDAKRQMLRVDTDEAGMEALQQAGLTVTIDTPASSRLQGFLAQLDQARVAGHGIDSIPGFQCFRTVEETYATMDTLVADHPGIAVVDEIGPTWKKTQDPTQGYTMRALRITNLATAAGDPGRPKMVVFSSIHAREYAPAEVDTRFAEWLVTNYGTDPEATWLVDHNDFRLVLEANPDGRKVAEQQIYQRKNMDTINAPCSSEPGVDLNRNFPFHWDITNGEGSSGQFCDETYRGPVPQSEPETLNLVQYVEGTCNAAGECTGGVFADRREGPMDPASVSGDGGAAAPDDTSGFFLDIHSNAALVLWPWGDTSSAAPNRSALRTFGRRLAWFNGYTPEQSDSLYPTDGTTDDTAYGLLGVPSYTIETNGADFFEDCGTFENDTSPRNIAALRYAARALHAPYLLPAGPDTIDVAAGSDLIAAGDPLPVSAHLDSSRFNQSNGTEPVHTIASAAAYVDALPWDANASPVALQAGDGTFDSNVESAEGSLDSSALAPGRHFIYVQGTDTAGNAGTPNAAFVDVAAADGIATLEGTIRTYADATPVAATVTVTDAATDETRSTQSDAVDGHYARTMLPGTVDVHVAAPGYLSEDAHGIVLAGGDDVSRDFRLLPNCTLLDDDVESGGALWTSQSPWAIVNNVPGNATHVWNTPNYGDDINRSLTLAQPQDLTGYSDIAVDFDDRCATESGYDYGYLEYSVDGGTHWSVAYACSGQTSWQSHHVDLAADANGTAAFKLRFRLQTDPGVEGAGWAVDNIRLEAGGDACRAQQLPNDFIFVDGFDQG